jgi:phosphoserine phosphatase
MSTSIVTTIFARPSPGAEISITQLCASYIAALKGIITVVDTRESVLSTSSRLAVAEVVATSTESVDITKIKTHDQIKQYENQNHVELAFQADHIYRRYKRLAVFDMDSTLIQQEVIDEIARKLSVEDKVSAITERAMNGELDFTASLRERVALLRGTPTTIFDELKQVITLTPGAADLVRALKRLGYKTAVLSGGFKPLTPWLAQRLGLDYAHANTLALSEDGLSLKGEVVGDIVHAERKRELVLEIAKENGISLDQVICIGDGANDLPMMGVAGLGIAFNAKPRVQQLAPVRLNSTTLLDALYLLGISDAEQQQLLAD